MSSTRQTDAALSLKITSDTANVAPARQAVEKLCADAGFDAKSTQDIGLAVNEALANIIRHAYGNATDQPIELNARVDGDELRISMRDWGSGENPEALPMKPSLELRPGGLGLLCMRQIMDSIVFTPQRDGMLLTMTRKKRGGLIAAG